MKTKPTSIFTVAFLLIPLLLAGCGGGKKVNTDTTAFDKAFKSAPADVQAAAAKASAAFKAEKLQQASDALTETAKKGGLTQEQKDSIIDIIAKIQTIMAVDPDKSDMKVFQSLENATAAVQGRAAAPIGPKY